MDHTVQASRIRLSVNGVILPDLDVVETCQLLRRLGYDGIEWRVRDTPAEAAGQGYSFWGEHKSGLTPANLAARARELVQITGDYGLEIPALATYPTSDELDTIARLGEGAARLGGVPIRVRACEGYDRSQHYNDAYRRAVDSLALALDVLRPFGVRALLEIHRGTLLVSASLAHRIVSNFPPEEVGVIYDVNNMASEGFETFRMGMELLGSYLQHCHAGGWRPVVSERRQDGSLQWEYEGCDLAESILDIDQFITDLKSVDYSGFISVEDFRQMDHTEKILPQRSYLRSLIDQSA